MASKLKKLLSGQWTQASYKEIQQNYRGNIYLDSKLSTSDTHVTWERAKEFAENPHDVHFFESSRKIMDIIQSQESRDSWFAASMVVVGTHKWLLKSAVPDDQGYTRDVYCGAFHFFFWRFGEWQEVIIDDQLPTVHGLLASSHFRAVDEMWPSLLEKAYLKCISEGRGVSVSSLSYGTPAEALTDLTGGLCEVYSLSALKTCTEACDGKLFNLLKEIKAMKGLMVLTARASDEAADIGLRPGMNYALIQIKKLPVIVNYQREYICLIKMKETTGNYTTWKGEWYPESPQWLKISSPTRDIMLASSAEMGEFWMTPEEMVEYFQYLTLCHVNVSDKRIVREVINTRGAWKQEAGSRSQDGLQAYSLNQQYHLHVRYPGFDHVVALMQITSKSPQYPEIGIHVYKVASRPHAPLPAAYLEGLTPVQSSLATPWEYVAWREVTQRYRLERGHYIIIPSLKNRQTDGQTRNFLIRVFAARQDYGLGHVHELVTREMRPDAFADQTAKNVFMQHYVLIQNNQYMDAERLHNALQHNFPQTDDDEMELDDCHQLLFCRRPSTEGVLTQQEFVLLFTDMWRAKKTFSTVVLSDDGVMNFSQFTSALLDLNIHSQCIEHAAQDVFEHVMGEDNNVNCKEFILSLNTLSGFILERSRRPNLQIKQFIDSTEEYVHGALHPEDSSPSASSSVPPPPAAIDVSVNIFQDNALLLNKTRYMDAEHLLSALTPCFPQAAENELTIEDCHHMLFCRRPQKQGFLSEGEFVLLYRDVNRAKATFSADVGADDVMNLSKFRTSLRTLDVELKHITNCSKDVFENVMGEDENVNCKEFILAVMTLSGYILDNNNVPISSFIDDMEEYIGRITANEIV